MAHAIREAIDEGAGVFDMLRGDEKYKRDWSTTPRDDLRLLYSESPMDWLAVNLFRVAHAAKRRLSRAQ